MERIRSVDHGVAYQVTIECGQLAAVDAGQGKQIGVGYLG